MKHIFSPRAYKKVLLWVRTHRFQALSIVLIVSGAVYYGYVTVFPSSEVPTYTLGTVVRGTVVSSVDASGQVSALDDIEIKPKASGEVTWVGVKVGDTVRAGQALAYLDATDAEQAVADAEHSLAQAKLQFEKDSAQAPIDYEQSVEAVDEAKKDLTTEYTDAFNALSDAYLALPSVTSGLQNILYGYDLSTTKTQWNVDMLKNTFASSYDDYELIQTIADIAERDYRDSRERYDESLLTYKTLTRYAQAEAIESSLAETLEMTTAVAQALQSTLNLLDTVIDNAAQKDIAVNPSVTALRSSAQSSLSTTNTRLSALLAAESALDAAKKAVRDAERSLEIYTIGNEGGANPISLQSSAYSIKNQERTLADLKAALTDYAIVAPFSGTVAALSLRRFDSVTTATPVATLITSQKIAELSLNEVDAARVTVGDATMLTFDALEGVSLNGQVVEIDPVGTVQQGVVSYTLKIAFDAADERIKPGMTVNASVTTESRADVLTVPASAVKAQGGESYVEIFDPELETERRQGIETSQTPTRVPVTVGISDDLVVEILSGLAEGQQIIVRTSGGSAAETTTNTGGFGGPGIRL